jgi:hypothetical protein
MAIGRMLNEIDDQDKADPALDRLDPNHTQHAAESQEDRADHRFFSRLLLIAVLILLGGAAVAGALLFNRLGVADTPTSVVPAVAPSAADPAAPAAENPVPGGLDSDSCVLPASAVAVDAVLTETITKEDSTQTGYRGAMAFTNTTEGAIYLNLRRSQSLGDAPDEGWYDYQIPLAPGETYAATVTGQSWTNRDPTWTVYTEYAAYPATYDCRLQVGGDDLLDALARPIPNPLPVGPGS